METAAVVHQVLLDGLIACTCINLCSFIFKLLFPIKIHWFYNCFLLYTVKKTEWLVEKHGLTLPFWPGHYLCAVWNICSPGSQTWAQLLLLTVKTRSLELNIVSMPSWCQPTNQTKEREENMQCIKSKTQQIVNAARKDWSWEDPWALV